ncbi:MAG: hypothetical protein K2V38_28370, partial [Gemmataceae bacterium]|nr:hypothetical protein [Gemmataceae bacterium]
QKYVFTRNVSTGEPPHVPDIISVPAAAAAHAVEKAVEVAVGTVTGRHHEKPAADPPPPDGAADQEFVVRVQEPSANGAADPAPAPTPENKPAPDAARS